MKKLVLFVTIFSRETYIQITFMGSKPSKPTKHVDRVKRSTAKHRQIIAQGPRAQKAVLFPKIIEELRRVSSNEKTHKELDELVTRQVARGLGDSVMRHELESIANHEGYMIGQTGNLVLLTNIESSLSR